MSVVPDRGSPTTKTGSSLSNPKPRTRSKKSGVQTAIIRVTSNSYSFGSYSWPRLRHSDSCRALPRCEVLGSFGILAPRVQDLGQAEVQQQSLCIRQLRFLQQLGTAQPDRSPEVCRPGVPPICNARRRTGNRAATRRGRSLPRPEDRLSPPRRCPGCRGPRQNPASVPVPGGSRRPPRPASPGPSRHYPGCCVLRHKSGFSSSARR